ncbi:MAG: ABC transporter permease subunit [Caldiserica bacterium]|nr:ABC transporter permease subunit [Caldisericota bacterium]
MQMWIKNSSRNSCTGMNRKILTLTHLAVKKYLFTPGFLLLMLVLILIPFWSSFLRGDGTMEGKFKVFITYSFLLTSLILTVVNISFSCIAISGEWKKKTLFLLDVKPIRRWEIILGKWFGLLTLNLFLIIAFLLSVSFSSLLLSHRLKKSFPQSKKNIFSTYTQVFPASSQGETKLKNNSLLTPPEVKASFPSSKRKETYAVPPRGKVTWNFQGIQNVSSDIYLVFRFYTSKKKKEILGYWLVSNPADPPGAEHCILSG